MKTPKVIYMNKRFPDKEIPRQYKYNSDTIIYNIGKLADKLYPIMTELGDNVEIKSDKCLVIIKKLKEDKE